MGWSGVWQGCCLAAGQPELVVARVSQAAMTHPHKQHVSQQR